MEIREEDWMNEESAHAIDDIDLAAAIAVALQFDSRVPMQITVEVSKAFVTLQGEVENRQQREAAELLVRTFDGVTGIHNCITLKPSHTAQLRPDS